MVKVETFIEITMKMSVADAREIRDYLGNSTRFDGPVADGWRAMAAALKEVEGVQ